MLETLKGEYTAQVSEGKSFPSFKAGDVLEVELVCFHRIQRVQPFDKGTCILMACRVTC
jgi:hypothetical protein